MAFVSIEINSDHLLLVASRSANRRFEVTKAIEIPIDADATAIVIGEKLKEVVDQNSLGRHDAIVVLSRAKTELREMTVPPAPDDELPDMVKFKARADFASLNENWLLDYVPLTEDKNVQRKVLASAIAPQVEQHVRTIIETAGLKLKQLVLRPYATLDLLRSRFTDEQCRLIIDPNCDSIDLTIVEGKKLVATRTVRIPTSYDDNARATQLISEVRRTLASTKRSLGGKKVTEVVLCDDPVKNKHLSGDLTKRLDLPVAFVDPFKESKFASDSLGKGNDRPYLFTSVMGSLSRAASGERPDVDFVNPRKPAEKKSNRERLYLYGGLAALAALLCIMVAWWVLSNQTKEIDRLRANLIAAQEKNEGGGDSPSVDTTLQIVGKIDDWKKDDVNWLDKLDSLSGRYLTADETIISTFSAANRKGNPQIAIKGKVSSTEDEISLVQSLKKTETVDGVDIQEFGVLQGGTGKSEDDKDYPMTFDYTVTITEDDAFIDKLNDAAREFNANLGSN